MINKEEYERGIRCKGMCGFCKDRLNCYQGIEHTEKYGSTIEMDVLPLGLEDTGESITGTMLNYPTIHGIEISKNATYRGEEIVDVRIMKLHKDAIIPTYAHDTDSGMDIFAMEDVIIQPHETVAIPTGIAIALPRCYELQLRPKSGNSLNTKLRIANAPSTIDEGYRGDIGVICDNIGDTPIEIKKGKAICQGVLRFVPKISWTEVDEFTDTTDRGTGAYGSSNRGI